MIVSAIQRSCASKNVQDWTGEAVLEKIRNLGVLQNSTQDRVLVGMLIIRNASSQDHLPAKTTAAEVISMTAALEGIVQSLTLLSVLW